MRSAVSEKIYAWMLGLHPARFREMYGEAALQLFRDRARDERGFFPRLRLWFDLMADLAVSLPRGYRVKRPAIAVASSGPQFHTLEGETPRLGMLLFGGVLSLAIAATALFMPAGHLGTKGALSTAFAKAQAAIAVHGASADREQGDSEDDAQAAPQAIQLNIAERHRVIQAVIANLKQHYIDSGIAQTMAAALLVHEKAGDYTVADDASFAGLVTKHMQDTSHDLHLELIYRRAQRWALPPGPPAMLHRIDDHFAIAITEAAR
jgi:hypothetical protein